MGSVLVAGSVNMDIVVTAERLPSKGETLPGRKLLFIPGGKGANQAVAAARLGATTTLIGRLGADPFGRELRAFLSAERINLTYLTDTDDASSGTALITVAEGHNTIIVVAGANGLLSISDVARPPIQSADVLVSQFETPPSVVAAFFERGRGKAARTILNPSPIVAFDRSLLGLADILVLNEIELSQLAGQSVTADAPTDEIAVAAGSIRGFSEQLVCVTLGSRGALVVAGDGDTLIAGRPVRVVDTTGAGDCFVGALAARLSDGASILEAANYANRAAAVSVQRMGAGISMPTAAEVSAMSD